MENSSSEAAFVSFPLLERSHARFISLITRLLLPVSHSHSLTHSLIVDSKQGCRFR